MTEHVDAEHFEDGPLLIHLRESADNVTVTLSGRSIAREPGHFLLPILTRAIETGDRHKKRVVLDFQSIEYLNSSTITPVIRILEQARRGTSLLTVVYRKDLKWQALSFSALYLFQSLDGRVTVEPK